MKIITLTAALAVTAVAQGSILTNGDFSDGTANVPADWTQWIGDGWNNREINANGLTPDNFHMALGNAGATDQGLYQEHPATAGEVYEFSVDSGSPDAWWHPSGAAIIEFRDVADSVISTSAVNWEMDGFDNFLAWQTYSTSAEAPVGTVKIRAILMNQGPDGGTMRFDNAVLIPEPASAMLLGLGSVALIRRRRTA